MVLAAFDVGRLLRGEPLPRLGHFDQKPLKPGISSHTRLLKASRCESLVVFCGRHFL